MSTPTEATFAVVNIIVKSNEAGVKLWSHLRIADVVTSAVLRMREFADSGTLELLLSGCCLVPLG